MRCVFIEVLNYTNENEVVQSNICWLTLNDTAFFIYIRLWGVNHAFRKICTYVYVMLYWYEPP